MNREILRLAIPSIVSNITVPLLGLADIAIMGHMGSANYLAAISVGAMIFNVMYWLMGFLRMSMSGVTAQAFGRKDKVFYNWVFNHGIQIGWTVGFLFVIMQFPLRELSLWLMQTSEETRELVSQYFNICIWGAPAVLGCYALNGWLIGMQNTVIPMRVAIMQNILNIALSVCFVFGLGMNIEGVAMGTLISQWSAFTMLYLFAKKKYNIQIDWNCIVKVKNIIASPLKSVGGVLFLRTICLVAVNLFFTSAGSQQGNMVLAVNTLLMTFFTIFSYFMDGFAFAAEALAGRFLGARDDSNMQLLNSKMLQLGIVMISVFTNLYYIGGDLFLSLLTNNPEVIEASKPYFFWVLIIPLCGVYAFIYDGIFTGLTRSRDMFLSCFIGAIAFFGIYLSPINIATNHKLWLALNLYLILRSLYLIYMYRK